MRWDRNGLLQSALFFFIGIILTAGGLTLRNRTLPAPIIITPPEPTPLPQPTATPGPINVHISGAVAAPAVYELPADAIVEDAISRAGGFSADAYTPAVNLAQPLSDGMQVNVPTRAEVTAPPPVIVDPITVDSGTESSGGSGDGLIDINTATQAELETLPRIGPTIAQAIIDYRDESGLFTTIEDIMNVSGIGEGTFEQIAPFITVTP